MRPEYMEIMTKIAMVPAGREHIALTEELLRRMDANQDVHAAYFVRRRLTRTATAEGFPEKAIVAHTWCVGQFDKDETIDDWSQLLRAYKLILEMIPVFPAVSREQIIRMQEDMATRLSRFGESERTAHYYRAWNFMRMGDYETAFEFQEKYCSMPRSMTSDCRACERDRQVELLSRMKRDTEALSIAEAILSGDMRCGEVPHFTHSHVTRSLLRMDRVEEASDLYPRAYSMTRGERKYLGTIGDLLLSLVRTRDFDRAVPHVVDHLPWARDTAAGELRFRFYATVALLFEALAEVRPDALKLRIPRELECWRENDLYEPTSLAAWFQREAIGLADQFDARNSNTAYHDLLADNRVLAGMAS